jgi:hypothetical protein
MSELEPEGNPNPGAKWVRAQVKDGDEPPPPPSEPVPQGEAEDARAVGSRLPALEHSEEDVTAAKWFSIAFLVITIPLCFAVLGLMIWTLFFWLASL